MYFQEPLRVYGEGDYGLTVVKEMNGTDEFKYLDVETRDCGLKESFLDCQTKHYLLDGLVQCKCVPYALKNYSSLVHNSSMYGQVIHHSFLFIHLYIHITKKVKMKIASNISCTLL